MSNPDVPNSEPGTSPGNPIGDPDGQTAGGDIVEPPRPTAPGFDSRGHVRRTRVSGVWIGLIGTAIFLILLIIFVAQNSRQVPIHFLGWSGHFSLALAILLAAVIGILIVAIPGTARIAQLRRALRKNVPDGKLGRPD
jgi:uncharacterized integral membrane protein